MKVNRKHETRPVLPEFARMDERPLLAWGQCQRLLFLFDQHARRGSRALATQMLENAAAHLELLADHSLFQQPLDPPVSIPLPIYNGSVVRRQKTQAEASDALRITTPTVEQLEALFDLPSGPED